MKRITALILTCLLSVGLLCGCGAQQPEPALPEIIIGSDTYPPYVYLDDNGDPTGIDVEIAHGGFPADGISGGVHHHRLGTEENTGGQRRDRLHLGLLLYERPGV